jgi:hypothetical protein
VPVPGRAPKLSGVQLRRLYTLVVGADPRQLEFPFALWTREMVRELSIPWERVGGSVMPRRVEPR